MKSITLKNRILTLFLSVLLTLTTVCSPQAVSAALAIKNANADSVPLSSTSVKKDLLASLQDVEDEEGVTDYVWEAVSTEDAMPAIENAFSGYRMGNVQTLDNDGHIGIPVELSVYYKSTQNVQSGPNGTPIILYVVNTPTVRTGTQSDVSIISSMLDRGYVVVVLNYKYNHKAVSPALEWSAQAVRNKLINGQFFNNLNKFTAGGTYYETFIVPAGYDVSLNHVYWEFDKHGADGSFENIVEVWNTDFRKDKGEIVIKWTDANGNRKAVQNDFDGNAPAWCNADGTANANGQYIKIKFTKAQTITDCVKKDGSPIDLNLYMHIIYPTNPKKAVPVMALNSSSEHLAKGAATLDRPQIAGFAFNGYASVMFDFGYTPMARDDHYGLFQPVVSGDALSYAVHFYSDKLIGAAAMRYIRYLSFTQDEFNFDTNAIGVYGNSKGGWITYLGEENPESFNAERFFKGHHGETRYENNKTVDEGVIDGGEEQPWLTYNGEKIDSGADFIYASCGGLEENITYGHAPTYVSCNINDTYNSYYTSSNGFVNMCRIYDIPCLWFESNSGHTLTSGTDIRYNIDTYPALFDFANFYLKKMPLKLLYTSITDGENGVDLDKELFFMFSGGVSSAQIKKLTPVTSSGEVAEGEWVGSFGGTHWTFYPKLLKANEPYTISIPKSFYGTNKVRIESEQRLYFTTKYAEVTQDQFLTTSKGTYVWFNVDERNEYILRAYVNEAATNRLQLYKLTNFNSADPDSATVGELLQEKVVYKSGNVEFEITDYCKALARGTDVAFLLKQGKAAAEVQGMHLTFDNGNQLAIAGKVSAQVADAPGGGKALKIVEMQPNMQYTSMSEFYDNITTYAAKYTPVKTVSNQKLTAEDVGRKYRLSFRVYDTVRRTMQVYLQSPTSKADGICDYNWVVKNFYTEPNKWVNVELEYVVYQPALYPEKEFGVPSMIFKACATGNLNSPFYVDDVKAVEVISDVNIESVSVEGELDWSLVEGETLAKSVLNGVSSKEHPYILYENSEIGALKEKIKTGYSQKAFDYVEKTAKKYLNASIDVYYNSASDKSNGIIGRQLQSYVAYLNTYSILTGDKQYAQKAIQLAVSAAEQGSTSVYEGINSGLCVSDFGYAYALAYDWLYSDMTSEQRTILKKEMEEIGAWLYNYSLNPAGDEMWGDETTERKAWNWNAVTHGALGMIAISLGKDANHSDWLARAIERMKGYYTFAVDEQGCAFEGVHYIGYAMNTLSVLDDTIYNLTGVELLNYHPHVYNLTDWSMRITAPYGNEQASLGQGTKLDNYAALFYLITKGHQRVELWGWERTFNLQDGGSFTGDYAGNGFNAPNIIFFEDQALEPLAPTNALPLVQQYDKGLVVARDGWDENDSMMTFSCGWGWQGTWNHPDHNSFTFFAKGESFVIDLGANYKTSKEHNIVLVDGTGFYYDAPHMIAGEILTNKQLSNGATYVKGDNTSSYRATVTTESTRQIVYMGGDTPYVIAFDYVYSGTTSHTFTTNFFTDFSSSVTTQGNMAQITGGNKGSIGYVYAFSPEGVSLSVTETDKTRAITSSNQAVTHKQATVFTTAMPGGLQPAVTSKVLNGNLQVSITYLDGGTEITDTYTFYQSQDVSVATNRHVHSMQFIEGVAATCESKGIVPHYYCSGCDKNFDAENNELTTLDTPAKGHNYGVWIPEINATCVTTGTKGHYCCADCNKNFDANYQEIKSLVLVGGNHNYGVWTREIAATCEKEGRLGHYHCSGCNKNFDAEYGELTDLTVSAKGHSKDYVARVEPTTDSTGIEEHYHCKECGKDFTIDGDEVSLDDLQLDKLPTQELTPTAIVVGVIILAVVLLFIKKIIRL